MSASFSQAGLFQFEFLMILSSTILIQSDYHRQRSMLSCVLQDSMYCICCFPNPFCGLELLPECALGLAPGCCLCFDEWWYPCVLAIVVLFQSPDLFMEISSCIAGMEYLPGYGMEVKPALFSHVQRTNNTTCPPNSHFPILCQKRILLITLVTWGHHEMLPLLSLQHWFSALYLVLVTMLLIMLSSVQ